MNELKVLAIAVGVSFLLGAVAGWAFVGGLKDAEIAEAQGDIRRATEASERLRDRLAESRRAVDEIADLAEKRQRELREMEEELYFYIGQAREREELIAGLTAEVENLGGRAGRIGELAREGRRIVESLLSEQD